MAKSKGKQTKGATAVEMSESESEESSVLAMEVKRVPALLSPSHLSDFTPPPSLSPAPAKAPRAITVVSLSPSLSPAPSQSQSLSSIYGQTHSLGNLNADIIINIIDCAHQIGFYNISHVLAQVNRYLSGIVYSYHRSFSALHLKVNVNAAKVIGRFALNQLRGKADMIDRLSLNIESNAVNDSLHSSGLYELIRQRVHGGVLKHLHLDVSEGRWAHVFVPATNISINAVPAYDMCPMMVIANRAGAPLNLHKTVRSLNLTNVELGGTVSGWYACREINLKYSGIVSPRNFSIPNLRRGSNNGLSNTLLAIADGCKYLRSLSIINTTYSNFFESDKVRYGFIATMGQLKELHIVRVNTLILRFNTPKLNKLKLEGCTDLEGEVRKLSPSLSYLSLAYGSFRKMPRYLRSDFERLDNLRTLDLSYIQDEFIKFLFKDKKYLKALRSLRHLNVSGTVVGGEQLLIIITESKVKITQLVALNCQFIDKCEQIRLSKKIRVVCLDKVKKGFVLDDELVFDKPHAAAENEKSHKSSNTSDSENTTDDESIVHRELAASESEDENHPKIEPDNENRRFSILLADEIDDTLPRYEWRRQSPPPPPPPPRTPPSRVRRR
ncbi:hypothetical protein E3P99_02101 [Wallemia hederae]|uniref:Uncharacterized protein n=1 Tax=Wallemia hederae TaxID=1540922 RepID=A0A4V4LT93_9BASI|nr:hypothetical protein E3P99_02101 [Wallemia hederae]